MEDVDGIMIPILKQVGCVLPNGVESVSKFQGDHVYHCCAMILRAINPDTEKSFPAELPTAKAPRFRFTTNLARYIKEEMQYPHGELGYELFLYPNERDVRRLLSWLVEKLPKVDAELEREDAIGGSAAVNRRVMETLRDWCGVEWSFVNNAPVPCEPVRTCRLFSPLTQSDSSNERVDYVKRFQPLISSQPPQSRLFPPSLFEHNCIEIVRAEEREKEWGSTGLADKAARLADFRKFINDTFKGAQRGFNSGFGSDDNFDAQMGNSEESSVFGRRRDFGQNKQNTAQMVGQQGVVSVTEGTQPEDEDALQKQREEALAALESELNAMKLKIEKEEADVERLKAELRQLEAQLLTSTENKRNLEDAYRAIEGTIGLLGNAEENMKKLQMRNKESGDLLVKLGEEWEKFRVPLITQYRKKKQLLNERKAAVGIKIDSIRRMRDEFNEKQAQTREKDELLKQLSDELNRLPKSINRQVYVRRIMDIVKNLEKQKVDIKKVLDDVRAVQKSINAVSKTSKRSFSLADETVFSAAQKKDANGVVDPVAAKAYRQLVQLRDGFVALIKTVEDTGRARNEIRDVTAHIEAIESRNTNLNMEKVETDLEQVKNENQELTKKLKTLTGKE